ncbi:MAG: carbon-nitrogen hydrolase family protein [Deltaproteobacteria bacterium]|nr:carbon-nitrogen hydrolase family protein [Deltaproteobacteria bacterium]MBW2306579.1 carbon-nitrogen hydrolase family protein [Deltaproteobacteria bacterium]
MGKKIVVGTVQFTRKLGDKEENIKRASRFIRMASQEGSKIISLPEFFSTGCFPSGKVSNEYFKWAETIPGPTTGGMEQLAKELNISIIAPIYEIDAISLVYYDSAAVITPKGVIGRYRKRHIPSGPHMIEKYYYAPGNIKYPAFDVENCKIAVSICYDRHFPETFRISALHGAQIVFSVNNTPTPRSLKMWFIEIQAASSSSGIFIVHNNAVGEEHGFFGKSFVAGPTGDVICQLDDEEGILVKELDLSEVELARLHYKSIWDTNWSDFGLSNEESGHIQPLKSLG